MVLEIETSNNVKKKDWTALVQMHYCCKNSRGLQQTLLLFVIATVSPCSSKQQLETIGSTSIRCSLPANVRALPLRLQVYDFLCTKTGCTLSCSLERRTAVQSHVAAGIPYAVHVDFKCGSCGFPTPCRIDAGNDTRIQAVESSAKNIWYGLVYQIVCSDNKYEIA